MKNTITESERLQLIGLCALASTHAKALTQIRHAAEALVGDTSGESCHVSDEIYSSDTPDADAILKRLSITVEG